LHTHAVLQEEIFKNSDKAHQLYERALKSSPNDCMVLNDFANFTNRALGDPTAAIELYVLRAAAACSGRARKGCHGS